MTYIYIQITNIYPYKHDIYSRPVSLERTSPEEDIWKKFARKVTSHKLTDKRVNHQRFSTAKLCFE
jgi:hypothetical protein